MAVRAYTDLIVWQKSMILAKEIHLRTRTFPKEELYGITSQIRRAAGSIPYNIAESQGKMSTGEFKQSLGHARGSLYEVQTQLYLAKELQILTHEEAENLLTKSDEIGRLLNGLINSLKAKEAASSAN
jgi:four helix bundle protein